MTGQWPRAVAEFGKAVEIDPVNHYAHFGLGLACSRTGDLVRAVAHLRLAVAMDSREEYREALERLTA
jgi:Flp pilus assembly protein TadD